MGARGHDSSEMGKAPFASASLLCLSVRWRESNDFQGFLDKHEKSVTVAPLIKFSGCTIEEGFRWRIGTRW